MLCYQGNKTIYVLGCIENDLLYLIFWGNSHLNGNIFKVQKRIIRIITNACKRDSCCQLYKIIPKIADKQIQTRCSVETFLDITNSSRCLTCGKCADLKLQLLQALNELSSVQLIANLLNKELKHKQDEQTSDLARNG